MSNLKNFENKQLIKSICSKVPNAFQRLLKNQKSVLTERYQNEKTLEETGKILGGISKERVGQIESVALGKLRNIENENNILNLKGYDLIGVVCSKCTQYTKIGNLLRNLFFDMRKKFGDVDVFDLLIVKYAFGSERIVVRKNAGRLSAKEIINAISEIEKKNPVLEKTVKKIKAAIDKSNGNISYRRIREQIEWTKTEKKEFMRKEKFKQKTLSELQKVSKEIAKLTVKISRI